MTKRDDDPAGASARAGENVNLTSAAQSLEGDLRKLEDTVREAKQLDITSDKTLQKARKLLEACSEHQLKLAGHLQELVAAMQSAQQRVQSSMDETLALSQKVGGRAGERGDLVERFATLGKRTTEINEPVNAVVEKHREGAQPAELLLAVNAVLVVTEVLVAEAEGLTSDAKKGNWVDIAKEADGLRQQILSARNKVMMLRRNLSERAPS
ncbi:MAG: hypothetical protein HOW73_09865 [Polyangiaceae bacterium]|nr:hypothetical protein [Polyangiaceae bacterium]